MKNIFLAKVILPILILIGFILFVMTFWMYMKTFIF